MFRAKLLLFRDNAKIANKHVITIAFFLHLWYTEMKAVEGWFVNLKERAASLKRDIPAVYLALQSKRTPVAAKLLAGITLVLALSPIDLIPDFIPVLGYLDDVLLLPGLIALTVKLIPPEMLADCRRKAEGMWQNGKPKKWYYALPIAGVRILLLWLIVKAFL